MQTEIPPPPAPPTGDRARAKAADQSMTGSQWLRLGLLLAFFVFLGVTVGIWSLVIVGGLVALIFCHELGHYLSAKRSGMKVTEFFIGFGPRIWSFQRGETEYGVKLIPAGAYVRIIGMHNLEEVDPADEARTYRQKPFKARLLTVLAGVAMNFLIALILIYGLLVGMGAPGGAIATDRDESSWTIRETVDGSAAEAAGIRKGERVVAIDGTPINAFSDIKETIKDRGGDTVSVDLVDGSERRTVDVTVKSKEGRGFLGVSSSPLEIQKVNPVAAVPQTFHEFGAITVASTQALGKFFSPSGISNFAGQVARGNEEAEPADSSAKASTSSETSGAEGDRLISLFGIVGIGSQLGAEGWATIVFLFVSINIFLGVVNLVPLLPFDGGHAVIATYEKIQELRRGRQGRYFTDVEKLLPLTYAVVVIMGMLFITTTYLDIVNPLSLN